MFAAIISLNVDAKPALSGGEGAGRSETDLRQGGRGHQPCRTHQPLGLTNVPPDFGGRDGSAGRFHLSSRQIGLIVRRRSRFASVDFDNFPRRLFGGRPAPFDGSWTFRGLGRKT